MELKKTDKFAKFPSICPYAYAFVFWRKSLLKKEYFYYDNTCRTVDNDSFYRGPLIIRDHIEYFANQIVGHQMSISGGINQNALFWVLEKIVAQFSENFFKAWLRTAGERSAETSVPNWKEIEQMRDRSFPNIAIAMLVMSNPVEENIILQKSVDKYVKKFSF